METLTRKDKKYYEALLENNEISNKSSISLLNYAWIDTSLGLMLAIADKLELYLLEFVERKRLETEIKLLLKKSKGAIKKVKIDSSYPIKFIEKELKLYFNGQLTEFNTPYCMLGSPFQKKVWEELIKIPYGQTRSYLEQAKMLGNPDAVRAVANANGMIWNELF